MILEMCNKERPDGVSIGRTTIAHVLLEPIYLQFAWSPSWCQAAGRSPCFTVGHHESRIMLRTGLDDISLSGVPSHKIETTVATRVSANDSENVNVRNRTICRGLSSRVDGTRQRSHPRRGSPRG